MSAALRLASALALAVPAAGLAQIQIDDRPKVLDPGPLSKDELNRRKAEDLLRDAKTLYGVAIVAHRHEKLLQAAATLEKAAALDPDSLEIRRALVPLYVSIGREDEAMTLCRQVLDQDPHDAETGFQFARLLKADGRPAEAIPVLQKAVATKAAQDRPERLLPMLSDLTDLLERQGDFAAAATAYEAAVRTMTEHREQLLYGNGFLREELQVSLARAYEHLGRARVKTKEYDKAADAFRSARDTLLKADDPEARHAAVRINWNLSELLAAQGKTAEALEALDAYLEYSPPEIEPYEKKAELLRKLGREREVVPALRRYAGREEFNVRLKLLLAQELAKEARGRMEAERIYRGLLEKQAKPEIYRGLFRLYQAEDRMAEVIGLLDATEHVIRNEDGRASAEDREAAFDRKRSMLTALRSDPPLVAGLLPVALQEAAGQRRREVDTWFILAALAARTHKLVEAETFFRQCLATPTVQNEDRIYSGLISVLFRQKKYRDVAKLCRDALTGRSVRNTRPVLFEANLAIALKNLGEFDEALTHADKAIKLSEEQWKVRSRTTKADILAAAGRFDDAVGECEVTLKEFPQLVHVQEVRYTLSNVYSQKGEHAKSEEQLRLILETDPDAPLANNNLGYQMADRNVNLDEAERLIRRALDADRSARKDADEDGENASYLDSLGWVLFRKGKLTEAREWLQKAAALPDGAEHAEIWDHLGDVYAKLDRPAKAKEAWQSALKLYKDDPPKKSAAKRAEVEKKLKSLD